jgi:hypothetical protein
VYLETGGSEMGKSSWRIQIYRALNTIDCTGQSKHQAKQDQGWTPGQAVQGVYSYAYKNLVSVPVV